MQIPNRARACRERAAFVGFFAIEGFNVNTALLCERAPSSGDVALVVIGDRHWRPFHDKLLLVL